MTQYKVELSAQAEADVGEIYQYIRQHGPANPDRWKIGLDRKLASIETFAEAYSFAPENEYTQLAIRQLLYGPFRILYEVQESSVFVLTVRHGARQFIEPEEFGDS